MQDILLGWMTFNGRDFYARQLHDMNFSSDIESMNPTLLALDSELCATTLSRAQVRTSDPGQISVHLGNKDTFDLAIASFHVRFT